MGIKKYKSTTPGRRWMTVSTFEEISTSKPNKGLIVKLKKSSGRNNTWRLTIRHQWWGHAKKHRLIDFYQVDKKWIEYKIETVEYDPYRSAWISLVCYKDGERRYVLAHSKVKVWDKNITDEKTALESWNRMEIWNIPTWLTVYNVELIIGRGSSTVRSAWSYGTVFSQEWEYTQVKLPSGEIRLIHKKCYASIGQVSNTDHNQIVIWKAWRSRWMWNRPVVRWKAMNPVDHPHGGWEWRASIWMKAPKTRWGMPALGFKTRSRKNITSKWILKTRKWKLMK